MADLRAHGIGVGLPAGWDGRIGVRRDGAPENAISASGTRIAALQSRPVVHLANFGLPNDRGDFGSGAVELMGDGDVFVVIFEHEPEAVHTALFATEGLPRAMPVNAFDPYNCRRGIPGQSAYQEFFQESGRAFCLYVVLGSHAHRHRLVPLVNRVLAGVRLDQVSAR
jgi:hypothetical protein